MYRRLASEKKTGLNAKNPAPVYEISKLGRGK